MDPASSPAVSSTERSSVAPATPVGLGGEHPAVSEHQLQRGDRVLCYTDGVIEERDAHGELFGGTTHPLRQRHRARTRRRRNEGRGTEALPRSEAGARRAHQRRRSRVALRPCGPLWKPPPWPGERGEVEGDDAGVGRRRSRARWTRTVRRACTRPVSKHRG
ncbi:SpoIIE family protein phosphatase [Streptomyces sp. NBC_01450]|uniref:SpoIIE family protein phosphatase n=1 Tax=Streptomyces sp. NBC_01450 TaxID=2903871 RepID=UPI003FCD414F